MTARFVTPAMVAVWILVRVVLSVKRIVRITCTTSGKMSSLIVFRKILKEVNVATTTGKKKLTVTINGHIVTAKKFAYDGCHKIYLLENKEEQNSAVTLGYTIFPIIDIMEIYEGSCSLRFISGWSPEFKQYVPQFETALIGVSKS